MNDELALLESEYDALCQRVKPCASKYTLLTERQDNGSPHVEFSGGEYHYIVTERGLDLESRSTADRSEILYWMVYDLTFWMGVAYEFKNRIDGPDVRRVIFDHWLDLMKKADLAFADRLKVHIAETLDKNPFIDQDPLG
ncbi:MAG TPA: Imm63 family immunity protein [Pyrinomonadaceae bacterium]|nr:Imm63 family immunity protein [Pyrinomonadaceae bacterium]